MTEKLSYIICRPATGHGTCGTCGTWGQVHCPTDGNLILFYRDEGPVPVDHRAAHESTIEEIKNMFEVNVVGLMACTSLVLPTMRERGFGHIINVASQAGKMATPKSSVYSATKHAVLGYSNSLRMELADLGVYVTTVNPGPIATNFFDIADEKGTYLKNIQRWVLKPEYVARQVVERMLTKTREINLPRWMNTASIFYTLFPRVVERFGKRAFNQK